MSRSLTSASGVCTTRRRRSGLDAALYAAVAYSALAIPACAAGLPTGPSVVAGQANITSPNATSTVVTQTSQKAIINWQSFSISSGSNVQFVQPDASAIALNRVIGRSPSEIFGNLSANGQVWLINGNGILFGHGSQINVGSLIATTADIQNGDFLAGNYNFSNASANASASVVNEGAINAANEGSVTLAGPTVSNRGLITANFGTVVLGGVRTFTIDFTGDNLLRFAVDSPVTSAPTGDDGQPQTALVTNSGTITASGGQITLTARAARSIVNNVISNTGVIDASSVSVQGGEVILDGGDGGVSVSGSISASGSQGGSISVSGESVKLTGAALDATGMHGGGKITVGSESTQSVSVDSHSTLDASAQQSGEGGTILVDAQDTQFHGAAIAQGGTQSGDGGNIETSGYSLDITGASIDTLAPTGRTGNWTLDPYNVTISDASTTAGSLSAGVFTPSGNDSVINVADLQTALASTNVTISTGAGGGQAGDISVLSSLTWSNATTLTLDAYHSINFDAPVTISGGGGLTLKTNDGGSGGDITFQGGNVAFTDIVAGIPQGSLSINGVSYTLLGTMAEVQSINSNLNGNYALAVSLDASTTAGWIPIGTDGKGNVQNAAAGFAGTFEGLGNSIANLTVNIGANADAGLFGYSSGTVRDIGLLGGSTTGGDFVGPLVGYNVGTVADSWATGSASGQDFVGGLVGHNSDELCTNNVCNHVFNASITNSYATGSVTGSTGVGGLAGENWGLISNSYATGNVTGTGSNTGGLVGAMYYSAITEDSFATGSVTGSNFVGGLVGVIGVGTVFGSYSDGVVRGSDWVGGLVGWVQVSSSVDESYSTGAVFGANNVGGLIGENDASVTHSYWDIDTSGRQTSSGGTGLTTLQFQSGVLPAGFVSQPWNTGSGLYPYLFWQFPSGTPQAISGFAYSDAGVTPLASKSTGVVIISALADGTSLGSAAAGANGYYYLLVAPGTLSGTHQVLTYLDSDAVSANTYLQSPDGNVSNADLYGGFLRILSGAGSTSSMFGGLETALGSNSGSNFLFDDGSVVAGTSLDIESSNVGGFAIDSPLNLGAEMLVINAAGPVGQSAQISAADVDLLGVDGTYTLTNANNSIGTLAANSGAISLDDATSLTIGSVNATQGVTSSGSVTLAVTGNITIASGAVVTGGNHDDVVLSASNNFTNDEGSGAIVVSGGGRWLVYSNAPGGDTFGGLDSANTAIWDATLATSPPASIAGGANRYLFAYQPTITFTSTNDTKTYGMDYTAIVAGDYTVAGLQPGVENAYLGDSNETAFSGVPSVTSLGSSPAAPVSGGPYEITVSAGSLTALDGYALAFNSFGKLTIDKASLTVTGTSVSDKVYDGTSAAMLTGGTLNGVIEGDSVSLMQSGNFVTVDVGSEISVVATDTITGPQSGNYSLIEPVGLSANITPKALTETLIGTVEKPFDGTTVATLVPGNYGPLSGVVGNDDVALASFVSAGTYDTSAVGSGKLVTVTGLTLTGAKAFDYTFSGIATGHVGVIEAVGATLPIIYVSQPPPLPPVVTPPIPGPNPPWVDTTPPLTGTGPIEAMVGGDEELDDPESQFAAELILNSLGGKPSGSALGENGQIVIIPGLLVEDTGKSQKPVGVPSAEQAILNWGNTGRWY